MFMSFFSFPLGCALGLRIMRGVALSVLFFR